MNKSQLIESLARDQDLPLKTARSIVNTIVDTLFETLVNGDNIEIRGFGSFAVSEYDTYTGRNPKTGARIHTTVWHGEKQHSGFIFRRPYMTENVTENSSLPGGTYEQKVKGLDNILRKLDESEIPIDELGEKVKIGAHLIIELQRQLKSVETEVQDAFKILDESFDKNISNQDDDK